jgi:hypothetical protein
MGFPIVVHLPDDERTRINSQDQWDDLILDLYARSNPYAPDVLMIENLHGYRLKLGLGNESFIHLCDNSENSREIHALGIPSRMGTTTFFLSRRLPMLIEMRCLIPFSIARRAVRKFIEEGVLSEEVDWEVNELGR